jgi:hypothetical protein
MLKRPIAIFGLLLAPLVPYIVEARDGALKISARDAEAGARSIYGVWGDFVGATSLGTFAQEATLSAPVARASEAKYRIRRFEINTAGSPNTAVIEISVQDSDGFEIRYFNVALPGSSPCNGTVAGLATAMMTTRATETGADGRKLQFRVLGYLSDQGCLPGVTLVP